MAYQGVNTFTKPHGSGNTGGSSGGTIIINKTSSSNVNPNYLDVKTLNANNASITNLKVQNATIDNANINYFMSKSGEISKIKGDELQFDSGYIADLSTNSTVTNTLKVNDEANIKSLLADYINSNSITTDYLEVTKSAHFFELIIDKMRSVQGTQINTAANCIADFVEAYAGIYHDSRDSKVSLTSNNADYYRIYFKTTDNNGKAITNDWLTYDQAICESFNVNPGTTFDTSNKYYWRLVNKTSNDTGGGLRYVNLATEEVKDSEPGPYTIQFSDFEYGSYLGAADNYTYFNVNPQVQGEWTAYSYQGSYVGGTFTPHNTIYGIEVTPHDNDIVLCGGNLAFTTDIKTKLNIGVYYSDGTYDYFPADTYKTNYSVETKKVYDENDRIIGKCVEAIIITTDIIDVWDSCHWIDLSNLTGEYDADANHNPDNKSMIPSKGDNICQLGYRYNMYPSTDPLYDEERASAIIIAAYRTPDNGDPNATPNPIKAVKAPSYAQYQLINDFDLSHHRGTYFDATGAYIKGNLVSGTVVEPGVNIPVTVDTWKILSDTSVITKDQNNTVQPPYITLSLLHNTGSSSQVVSTLPSNMKLYVNGTDNYTYSPTNPLNIVMSYFGFVDLDITLQSYTGTPQTYDELVIDTFTINATNGKNGSYYQFIYKNDDEEGPSTPTQDAFPPTGWTTSPTEPIWGEYTWMSQRLISFSSSNVESHGSWTTPIRITGENGEDGTDGKGIEFIYMLKDDIDQQTGEFIPPELWQNRTDVPDDSSPNIRFNPYTGDIEGWTEITGGVSTVHYQTREDYLPPSNESNQYFTSDWTDDPQGVSEDCLCEWVCQRTYDGSTHQWSKFSEPVIWAKYGLDGEPGQNGINGQNGQNGTNAFNNIITYDKLDCSVSVTGQSLSSITSALRCIITNLSVHHIENGTDTLIPIEAQGYSLYLDVICSSITNNKSFVLTSGSIPAPWTKVSDGVYNINETNLLSTIYPSASYPNSYYRDYLKLQKQALSYLPIQLVIYCKDNNGIICTERLVIDINMHAGYINMMSEAGLYQAFFGNYSYAGNTYQGISTITATMQGIQTDVSSLSTSYNTLVSDYTTFKQAATYFESVATQQISYQGGEISTMQSQITQMPDQISAAVYQEIDGDLKRTGIDITNESINLSGDKVTFSDSTGLINDKIQIDPSTGTLIAENAYITGKIEANEGKFGTENGVFNMILDADNTSFLLKGAKEVKCHEEGGQTVINIPYEKWADNTYPNFKFIETTLNRWGNASYDAGGTTGRIALNPTIILRIPYAGYDTSTDDMYTQMEISPNEGIVFKQKINGVESLTGVISNGGIHINGSLGLGTIFVLMNNFANNQAAINAGLQTGDLYHTNGVVKVVI